MKKARHVITTWRGADRDWPLVVNGNEASLDKQYHDMIIKAVAKLAYFA